jgi:hypothetical protein
MTQDEISELARKAGLFGTFVKYKNEIETFAKLVVEKERTWVRLTNKEILADDVLKYYFGLNGGAGPVSKIGKKIVNAIESKLKEKNT